MTKTEAQLKGVPWTDFKDIPECFKRIYILLLAVTPLAYETVMGTVTGINTYEQCCEYWFNNQLIDITEKLSKEGHASSN